MSKRTKAELEQENGELRARIKLLEDVVQRLTTMPPQLMPFPVPCPTPAPISPWQPVQPYTPVQPHPLPIWPPHNPLWPYAPDVICATGQTSTSTSLALH